MNSEVGPFNGNPEQSKSENAHGQSPHGTSGTEQTPPEKGPLTEQESVELKSYTQAIEAAITEGRHSDLVIGESLHGIREKKLHREKYKDIEGFAKKKWKMSRAYAYRQIGYFEVATILRASPIGDKKLENEGQARELSRLKGDPQKLIQAWTEVVGQGGEITAKSIREVVDRILGIPAPPKPKGPISSELVQFVRDTIQMREGTPDKKELVTKLMDTIIRTTNRFLLKNPLEPEGKEQIDPEVLKYRLANLGREFLNPGSTLVKKPAPTTAGSQGTVPTPSPSPAPVGAV